MAWFGAKNTWGNFPDLAGAVNKLQESVKNIEKNFDTALGFEEKSESSSEAAGSWPLVADRKTLFNPVMSFMGNKAELNTEETSGELTSAEQESGTEKSLEQTESPEHLPVAEGTEGLETDNTVETETSEDSQAETEESTAKDENKVHEVEEHGDHDDHEEPVDGTATLNSERGKSELPLPVVPVELSESIVENVESLASINEPQESETAEVKTPTSPETFQHTAVSFQEDQAAGSAFEPGESDGLVEVRENFQEKIKEESREEERFETKEGMEMVALVQPEASSDSKEADDAMPSVLSSVASEEKNSVGQSSSVPSSSEMAPALVLHENEATANQNEGDHLSNDAEVGMKEQCLGSVTNMLDSDSVLELERVREMKMMETALQDAARQAQAKADEIAKLVNENEQLKSVIEELKRNSNEAEIETLQEEYHQGCNS